MQFKSNPDRSKKYSGNIKRFKKDIDNCHSDGKLHELEKQQQEVFYKIVVLKNARIIEGNIHSSIYFFDFTNKITLTRLFSVEFSPIFQNSFLKIISGRLPLKLSRKVAVTVIFLYKIDHSQEQ